jgi:hypothetical protein
MSSTTDLHNLIAVSVGVALTAVADGEDVVGAVIDMQGAAGLEYVLQVGAYTDGSVTPLVEDSANGTDFAAVDDKFLLGTEAGAALTAAGVSKIGYIGSKRYVRLTAVTAAGSTLSVGASAIKFGLSERGNTAPNIIVA